MRRKSVSTIRSGSRCSNSRPSYLTMPERGVCVGYKDISPDEFWVRGHMPGMPLMPGVIICEAAAQMCSYFVQRHNMMNAEMMGFGGMDEVRFRGTVVPGDRLVIVAERLQVRLNAMIRCRFQCFVGDNMVCDGKIRGHSDSRRCPHRPRLSV